MAVDEALMAGARAGAATLRFYAWEPGCLSLGRNQSTPDRVQGRLREELQAGETVVRRPTGGRSVYHSRELTYSVTVPDRLWGGPRRLYQRINRALRRGLTSLGAALDPHPGFDDPAFDVEPGFASEGRARGSPLRGPRPGNASHGALGPQPCFQAPAPGEVTARGRKLVGSAQWRHGGALLQHGSILLLNEQGRGDLHARDADRAERAAIGLSELVRGLPAPVDLVRTLTDAFSEEFGCRPERAALDAVHDRALEAEARRLVADKYRTPEWTWRR
jgi:lipoate-protein ligase A